MHSQPAVEQHQVADLVVTGATGRVGSRVARRLVAQGRPLTLLVRDPVRAPLLPGARVVAADYGDPAAAEPALAGARTVFMVSAQESQDRVHVHRTFVDAAARAGVQHLVYLSFITAAEESTFTLGRDHWHTEQHARASGMGVTFLRDSMYADFLPMLAGPDGVLRGPAGDGRVAPVTLDDVADAATAVLLEPLPRRDARRGVRLPRLVRRTGLAGRVLGLDLHRHRARRVRPGDRPRPAPHRPSGDRAGGVPARRPTPPAHRPGGDMTTHDTSTSTWHRPRWARRHDAHLTQEKTMDGSVQTFEFPALTIHVYTAPSEGFAVNTVVLELEDRLVVVDGQMTQTLAREAGDVIEALEKPLDRFVLSHNHPDHYSGFAHLTARFPGVQLATLPAVRDYLLDKGEQVLAGRRALFGDDIAAHPVIPDATIVPGELTISGVRFLFQQYDDTESEHTLAVLLPDLGVALLADLVAAPTEHLFTLQPHFDEWERAIHRIRTDVARYGIHTIVVGHGSPVGPEALPAVLQYLQVARQAYATASTSEEYKAAVTALVPDRGPQAWLDWSGQMLYGHVAP